MLHLPIRALRYESVYRSTELREGAVDTALEGPWDHLRSRTRRSCEGPGSSSHLCLPFERCEEGGKKGKHGCSHALLVVERWCDAGGKAVRHLNGEGRVGRRMKVKFEDPNRKKGCLVKDLALPDRIIQPRPYPEHVIVRIPHPCDPPFREKERIAAHPTPKSNRDTQCAREVDSRSSYGTSVGLIDFDPSSSGRFVVRARSPVPSIQKRERDLVSSASGVEFKRS